jgi:hypothetical protein
MRQLWPQLLRQSCDVGTGATIPEGFSVGSADIVDIGGVAGSNPVEGSRRDFIKVSGFVLRGGTIVTGQGGA